jgi:hypothetical protein
VNANAPWVVLKNLKMYDGEIFKVEATSALRFLYTHIATIAAAHHCKNKFQLL